MSTAPVPGPTTDGQRLGFLLKHYVRPYWRSTTLLIVLNLVITLITVSGSLIAAAILDILLGRQSTGATGGLGSLSLSNAGQTILQVFHLHGDGSKFKIIAILALAGLALNGVKALLSFGNYVLALWIRMSAARDMQRDMFRHVLSFSLGFFHHHRTGELMSRLEGDTRAAANVFHSVLGALIISPLLILIYGVLIVRASPILALATLGCGGLHYLIAKTLKKSFRKHAAEQHSLMADVQAMLQETLLSIRVVKSFGAEAFEAGKFQKLMHRVIKSNVDHGYHKHLEEPARDIANRFIDVCVLLFAAWEVTQGRLHISTFLVYMFMLRQIVGPISNLGSIATNIQSVLAAMERICEFFNLKSDIQDGPQAVSQFKEKIELQNVTFAYGEKPVLQEINLHIRKGEVVALVGPSGAGKSTLVDLVMRFYDPQQGQVLLDGVDLCELKQNNYRKLFGVVSQESLLFNDTIRNNITYGRTDLSDAQIERAAKVANAHEFIVAASEGYQTVVGDRGVKLSGGQRQRIAIARAVAGSPEILILDEATSALDSESERLVQEAIDRVIESTTAIVIAHRLSTILHADKIVVFENGRILDMGKHAELLERCALYRHLCSLQFGSKEVDPA